MDRFAKHIDDSSVEYEELLSLMIDDHQLPEPNPMYQIIIKFVTSMFLYHQMNVTRNIRIKIKEESEKNRFRMLFSLLSKVDVSFFNNSNS